MSTLTSALAILGALALLEVLLSADNVLILAVLLQDLPERDQSRAQLYGLVGAVALRLISVLLAFLLLRSALLQLLGALYLIYLPSAHFLSRGEAAAARPTPSFWAAVVKINLADLAFSIDSILAGVALVAHHFQGALAVGLIATGGVIGLLLVRFATSLLLGVVRRYPSLDRVAYLLVGWIGLKLLLESGASLLQIPFSVPEPWFWIGALLLAGWGGMLALRPGAPRH